MYSPKDICGILNISYETLKFYCKEGLVPNVHRDQNNRRVFDDRNLGWLKGLLCLRNCGMSHKDMKIYMELCLKGKSSIPERKAMLADTRDALLVRIQELQGALDYIDQKQLFYDNILAGKEEYRSNLIDVTNDCMDIK